MDKIPHMRDSTSAEYQPLPAAAHACDGRDPTFVGQSHTRHTGSMNRAPPHPAPHPLLLCPQLLGFGGLLTLLPWSEVVPASDDECPLPAGKGGAQGGLGDKQQLLQKLEVKEKLLSRVRLCDPLDYTVHRILQAKILEWVAVSFSGGSFQPRDRTQISHIAGGFFTS